MLTENNHSYKYSIVVPFHNEEPHIRELHRRLIEVMEGRYEPFEMVYVDDHSNDATAKILSEIAAEDERVTVIRLKRNYGQTVALAAGFDSVSGDIIISMDGDLQHQPEDIPNLLQKFEETGCDIVSGWRKERVDNFLFRRLPSRAANWLIAKLSGVQIHDFGTTFKVYRREIISQIRLYGEMHRFIPVLAAWNGATIEEAPIRNSVRTAGASHYGLSRTFRVLFDILTTRFLVRYVTRPLHFFGPLGLVAMMAGGGIAFWLTVEKFIHHSALFDEHGPLMIFSVVLFLGGMQLITSGLLAELISRTYFESQNKPTYFVERVIRSGNVLRH